MIVKKTNIDWEVLAISGLCTAAALVFYGGVIIKGAQDKPVAQFNQATTRVAEPSADQGIRFTYTNPGAGVSLNVPERPLISFSHVPEGEGLSFSVPEKRPLFFTPPL